ncbi:hypothetical protein ACWCQZ_36430 [Streptomyces sp. NPDC002285]
MHRLTDGDPLLLGEHLRDLLDHSGRLTGRADSLSALPAGLDGVFKRWWQDQQELWRARYGALGLHAVEVQVKALMAVFSQALGPLRREDLAQVAPGLGDGAIETALAALDRFLVGEGTEHGHVLSHPRLAEHWGAREMNEAQRQALHERFAAWGLAVNRALDDGSLAPAAAPPYVVQYLAAHLNRTRAPVTAWLSLLSPGRQRAWTALDGTYAGFLTDVHTCREVFRRADAEALAQCSDLTHLADDILCALIDSSVGDEARGISPTLLGALVRHGMWTPVQALVYARRTGPSDRPAALLAVAAEQSGTERRETVAEALQSGSQARRRDGADVLAAAVSRAVELGEARAAAEYAADVLDLRAPSVAAARVIPFLTAEQRTSCLGTAEEVLRQAAVAATLAPDSRTPRRVAVLTMHLPFLNDDDRRAARVVLRELLEDVRPHAMSELAEIVAEPLLTDLLALVSNSENGPLTVNTLGAVASRLPDVLRAELVPQAVAVALDGDRRAGGWFVWGARASMLDELMDVIPTELHAQALDIALSAPDDIARGDCLLTVLAHLTGEQHAAGVAAARALALAGTRALALTLATNRAPADRAADLAREAVDTARESGDRDVRAATLPLLAPALDDEELIALVQEATRELDGPRVVLALCGIGSELCARGHFEQALSAARRMVDGHDRIVVLLALASGTTGADRETLVREVTGTADGLPDAGLVHTLARHQDLVDEEFAPALMGRALAVSDPRLRSVALRVVLSPLSGPLEDEVRDAAIDCAVKAHGSIRLFAALARLGHAEEAFAACDAMDLSRASYENVVSGLAPYLAGEQVPDVLGEVVRRVANAPFEGFRAQSAETTTTIDLALGGMVPGARVLTALARRSVQTGRLDLAEDIVNSFGDRWLPDEQLRWIRDLVPFVPEEAQRQWVAGIPSLLRGADGMDVLLDQTLRAIPPALRSLLYTPGDAAEAGAETTSLELPGLAVLAPLLPEPARTQALDEVWQRAHAHGDGDVRARVLRAVAVHLTPDRRAEAGAELLKRVTECRTTHASPRGTGIRIGPIAPHLTEAEVRRFLVPEWFSTLGGGDLVALLVRLTRVAGPREALTYAVSLRREGAMTPWDEQALLVRIAEGESADTRRLGLERALVGARKIGDGTDVLRLMANLAGATPAEDREPLVKQCLRAYKDLTAADVPEGLGLLLESLLPVLDRTAQHRLLEETIDAHRAALFATGAASRVIGLAAAAGHGELALRTAVSAPPGHSWDEETVTALAALPEELVDQAVETACTLALTDADGLPIPLLCGLANRFAGRRREQLVLRVLDMTESSALFPFNLKKTLALMPPLPRDAIRRFEQLAARLGSSDRGHILGGLAPSMTKRRLQKAIRESGALYHDEALTALEGVLPELCRRDRAQQAMRIFGQHARSGKDVSRLMRALAPVIPPDLIPELIESLGRFAYTKSHQGPLYALLALRAPETALRSLEEEVPFLDGNGRSHLLAALARRADGGRATELVGRAVAESRTLRSGPIGRRQTTRVLGALADAAELMNPASLADTLLISAREFSHQAVDNRTLHAHMVKLTSSVAHMRRSHQYEVVRHFLDGTADAPRSGVLAVTGELAPVVAALGGPGSTQLVLDALLDVQRRWP